MVNSEAARRGRGNAGQRFTGTVIYVHGIANKPRAATLKCQWDRALFGTGLGQRSRMVYWVNRDRFPDPYPATCKDEDNAEDIDFVDDSESMVDESADRRLELAEQQAEALAQRGTFTRGERRSVCDSLIRIAEEIEVNAARVAEMHAQDILPLPNWARERLTRVFTRLMLNDVYDYFFDAGRGQAIDQVFRRRLRSGGPFVVVAHSLGSVIAYANLWERGGGTSVPLLVTMGSPLGLPAIQRLLVERLRCDHLEVPPCVANWMNAADPLDFVAADPTLDDDFGGRIDDQSIDNLGRPRHPHAATGYLGSSECRSWVRQAVGAEFAQPIASFSVARDLSDQVEDSLSLSGGAGGRHHVLLELCENGNGDNLERARERLLSAVRQELRGELDEKAVVHLRRYLAMELTSGQIELLGPLLRAHNAGRVWSDSEKMSLNALRPGLHDPIQSEAATRVYLADGDCIDWAVLDTGVRRDHPHFKAHGNVVGEWNCTQNGAHELNGEGANDNHGHGTHVAATIAGAVPDDSGDPEARDGVARKTRIHSYKVLDDGGRGRDSFIIRALDHIAGVNEQASRLVIHGVNLSLGGPFDPQTYGCGHSPICRELRRLWRQGVLVVVAAGNAGFAELESSRGALRANLDLSIGDPANLEEAIAVGSVHLHNPHTYGTSYFSSRGPTADGRQKPDLVAPGERIRSANYAFDRGGEDYIEMSGTSMAAPHVSGLLAAFLSQRRELIGEPARVKERLLATCTDLGRDRYVQGAGLPNLVRLLLST